MSSVPDQRSVQVLVLMDRSRTRLNVNKTQSQHLLAAIRDGCWFLSRREASRQCGAACHPGRAPLPQAVYLRRHPCRPAGHSGRTCHEAERNLYMQPAAFFFKLLSPGHTGGGEPGLLFGPVQAPQLLQLKWFNQQLKEIAHVSKHCK